MRTFVSEITLTSAVRGEIRAEIARRYIKQDVLAAAWGISQAAVSSRLKADSTYELNGDDIASAARALGYEVFEFIERAQRNAAAPKSEAAA